MGEKKASFKYEAFDVEASRDPEVARLLRDYTDAVAKAGHAAVPHKRADLGQFESGKMLARSNAEWASRVLKVLLEYCQHLQVQRQRLLKATEAVDPENPPQLVTIEGGGIALHWRWFVCASIIRIVGGRKLPLGEADLIELIDAAEQPVDVHYQSFPGAVAVKQATYAAKDAALSEAVQKALMNLRQRLDVWRPSTVRTGIDKLLKKAAEKKQDQAAVPAPPSEVPKPGPAGSPGVMAPMKKLLGMLPDDQPAVETTTLEPDGFELRADSPLKQEHELISQHLEAFLEAEGSLHLQLGATTVGVYLKEEASAEERGRVVLAACERAVAGLLGEVADHEQVGWKCRRAVSELPDELALKPFELSREGWLDCLLWFTTNYWVLNRLNKSGHPDRLRSALKGKAATEGERYVLLRLCCTVIEEPPLGVFPPLAEVAIEAMGYEHGYWLAPGERWVDQLHADMAALADEPRRQWYELIKHARTAKASKPSSQWNDAARPLYDAIGAETFAQRFARWTACLSQIRSVPMMGSGMTSGHFGPDVLNDGNGDVLRGLVWMATFSPSPDLPRQLADLLMASIRKTPGVGPKAVKIANACIWALGELAGCDDQATRTAALGQLARLKARVRFKTTLKAIEKAFDKAAQESGIPREDIEEMAVPTYGLEEVGRCVEQLGEYTAVLEVTGTSSTQLRWIKPDGKPQKSIPKAVKDTCSDELKDLKAAAKDIGNMLPAMRDRLDLLHLQQKTWPYATWADRYLDHPLIGTLARRLIWSFSHGEDGPAVSAAWLDDQLVDADGQPVSIDKAKAVVSLWHPIGQDEDQVVAWRAFFESREIAQPFKQAHREVYLLTDAERNTGTYSNRFAAHILRQHQFNALCSARGWHNKLRLMVDDEYPPAMRELPAWGLRAEFWIEGIGNDYGVDTTESGSFLHLATDQVRFYSLAAAKNTSHAAGGGYAATHWTTADPGEPIALDQIPPLVFSEVMRDVDLFVGVASVGNDPLWEDRGRDGTAAAYWHDYSFGHLSATAGTRKQLLERLIPCLKIADRCSFSERFLIVKGELRTYHIHLGSGNILMEPNDQYLCIVPSSGAAAKGAAGKVFLPFEGDRTLSIILSKAFMLAEDTKIKDGSIVSQIKRGQG